MNEPERVDDDVRNSIMSKILHPTNQSSQLGKPPESAPVTEISENNPSDSGLVRNLRKALNDLHPRYRIPVILKDVEGFSQEEIAQILKRPIGTVKARITRGRDYLKKELEKVS